jgi:hypothetical protein
MPRKPGGLAESAALKSHVTKSEIAGYRLDRVLELDMVPPTVKARYNGKMTGLQLWVLNCRELKELKEQDLSAPDPVKSNKARDPTKRGSCSTIRRIEMPMLILL